MNTEPLDYMLEILREKQRSAVKDSQRETDSGAWSAYFCGVRDGLDFSLLMLEDVIRNYKTQNHFINNRECK